MTAKEMLRRMPELLDSEAAADTEAVIQYEISEPVYQVLKEGRLTVFDGRADDPNLTVTASDENLLRLFRGQINPMTALMTGKLRVAGDLALAQRLVGFVRRDRLEALG